MTNYPDLITDPWYIRIYKLILISIFIYIPIITVFLIAAATLACCMALPLIGFLYYIWKKLKNIKC